MFIKEGINICVMKNGTVAPLLSGQGEYSLIRSVRAVLI